ncbi:MAG: NUDIX hydrolase [Hyphomicrobiaceae bacterium]|nr:NUDIX hydrolase [Hyphomicrobiaceae bacterium]
MAKPTTPLLTVDCVVVDEDGKILLIRRRNPPFAGLLALPGGFVDKGETVEAACRREVQEETGVELGRLQLVGVYSRPDRDPRGHTCSVVFIGRVRRAKAHAGDDAASVEWRHRWKKEELAFDHHRVLADARLMLADANTKARAR